MPRKQIPVSLPELDLQAVYRFCGNGLGIAGLPHEVTPARADALGLLAHLQAAVQNGDYQIQPVVAKSLPAADEAEKE